MIGYAMWLLINWIDGTDQGSPCTLCLRYYCTCLPITVRLPTGDVTVGYRCHCALFLYNSPAINTHNKSKQRIDCIRLTWYVLYLDSYQRRDSTVGRHFSRFCSTQKQDVMRFKETVPGRASRECCQIGPDFPPNLATLAETRMVSARLSHDEDGE